MQYFSKRNGADQEFGFAEGQYGILNVIAAALGAFAFGAVWYVAMSKPWIKAAGIPVDATGKPQANGSPLPFVLGLLAMVIVVG